MKLETKHLLWLFIASIALFFVHLDLLPVNIMEARNFITAREMLLDDNWLLTTLNGEPRYHKPPFPTWLTALSAGTFGLDSLYAMRLPAALIATFATYFFYRFSSKFTQHKELAFSSSLILMTSFYFLFAGRNGQWDVFTHGFMIAAIYYLYLFFSASTKTYQNALVAALFIGLSFMSKGPVSFYALLLPFLIAYGIVFKFSAFQKKWTPLILLISVAAVVSSWWYLYIYTMDPDALAEITSRETKNWSNYNVKPFYYYWSFFTQTGLWTIPAFISLLYPYLKNKVIHKKGYLFSFLWTISAVVLLSIIPEKKQRYLLPVIIPLALNIGFYIEYLFRSFAEMRRIQESGPVYFQFGAVVLIGLLFPFAAGYYFWDNINSWSWFILLSVALFSTSCFIAYHLYSRNIKKVFYGTILFTSFVLIFGLPLIDLLNTNPVKKNMSQLADWEEKNNIPVYEYDASTVEFIWYYGKKMEYVYVKDTKDLRPTVDKFAVLAIAQNEEELLADFKNYTVIKVDEFDLNMRAISERGHRKRLHRYLYVISIK